MDGFEPITAHSTGIESMCVAGCFLFTASKDGTVKRWSFDNESGVANEDSSFDAGRGLVAIAINPDGPYDSVFTISKESKQAKQWKVKRDRKRADSTQRVRLLDSKHCN